MAKVKVKKILWIASLALIVAMAGCSTRHTGINRGFTPHVSRSGLDPLLDAPLNMQTECRSKGLFSAGEKLGGFSFECSELDVTATLNELRDAGWRLEKMHIGKHQVNRNASGTPLLINIKKVY